MRSRRPLLFPSGVFCVEVAPDGGVKSICIRGADGTTGGFLVANRCPAIQRVMIHTYHTEMNSQSQSVEAAGASSSSSSSRSRPSIKLPDFDFHFFASEGETVAYGWPFPFTYSSRPVRTERDSRQLLRAPPPLWWCNCRLLHEPKCVADLVWMSRCRLHVQNEPSGNHRVQAAVQVPSVFLGDSRRSAFVRSCVCFCFSARCFSGSTTRPSPQRAPSCWTWRLPSISATK